jgi:hypothetical protein
MTTPTPVPPPCTSDVPPPIAAFPEPPKKSHTLLWLVLGGLALLLATGVATIAFLSGGGDDNAVVDGKSALINDHNAEAGEPAFVDVPGYVYTDPASDAVAAWDKLVKQGNEEQRATWPRLTGDFFTAWSVHAVNTQPSDYLAALFLMETNPQLLGRPGWEPDQVVPGLAGSMADEGSTVTTVTIDGEVVAFVAQRDTGDVGFAWYHDGTIHIVNGADEDEVRAFVEAYITEQNR